MYKRHRLAYEVTSIVVSVLSFVIGALSTADSDTATTYIFFALAFLVWVWYGFGAVTQSLAQKKGYDISCGWGFWFGIFALLYWGFTPVHPMMQADIIANGIRRAQEPVPAAQQVYVEQPPNNTACPSCNKPLDSDAVFCHHCGYCLSEKA